MKISEEEVRDMFGDSGNFADYWLNIYGPPDHKGWTSADKLLRKMAAAEAEAWDPDDEMIESVMSHEFTAGGGLMGATPELTSIRASIIKAGEQALAWERKLGRLARR